LATNIAVAVRYHHLPRFAGARSVRVAAKPALAIVLAGAVAGVLSGCSATPSAAIVNGQAISLGQLDQRLHLWASSPAYVDAEDETFLEQAEQAEEEENEQVQASSVLALYGSGAGVYGLTWSDIQLSDMIFGLAMRQHLARLGEAPTPVQFDAAWDSEDALNATEWGQLTPALRTSLATQDADEALVNGSVKATSQDTAFYKDNKSHFWSQVCVSTVDISVVGRGGGVDMAASKQQADQVASQLSGHSSSANAPVTSGGRYCDSPEQFIEQPAAFQKQVGALAPSQATVLAESYGYQVVEVRSRPLIAFGNQTAGDIDVVASGGGSQNPPTNDAKVTKVLSAANVQLNSTYGTWTALPAPCPPEIVPPGEAASSCPS
jgi:hypothetical protein